MAEYLIRFPVGDWSDDGHGKYEEFLVRSNKPVNELREIHYSVLEKFGFDIGDICSAYEETELSEGIITKLKDAGFPIEWKSNSNFSERYFLSPNERSMGFIEVFNLWIDILMFLDSELKIEDMTNDFDDINFYGSDEKNRHVHTPGYGCFI